MLPHLSFVAEFSKTISVLAVLVLLVLMMAYLSRVTVFPDLIPGSSSSVTWVQRPGISEQTMLLTPNPFQLQMGQRPVSSPGNLVWLKACSLSPCLCVCWWGVDLRSLHTVLAWPWPQFRSAVLGPRCDVMPDIYLISEKPQPLEGSIDVELEVPHQLQDVNCLGTPPRIRCPLVVTLIIPNDPQLSETDNPARVVALVTVVHVKDSLVPKATGILSQFLKQANGQITNLQPLYLSGVSDQNQDGNSTGAAAAVDNRSDNVCCVVCHCNPAALALLPCRHACLCSHCLPRLSNCPLCRTHITSCFHVVQSCATPDSEFGQHGSLCENVISDPETVTRLRNVVHNS